MEANIVNIARRLKYKCTANYNSNEYATITSCDVDDFAQR